MQVDSITYTNLTGRPDDRTVYTVAASVAYPRTLIFAVNRRRLVVIGMAPTAEHDVESAPGVEVHRRAADVRQPFASSSGGDPVNCRTSNPASVDP